MMSKRLQCMVANCGVAGYGLHDANLSGPHMVREVLVVGRGSGEGEEERVAEEGDTVLHAHHHLLSHPLSYQVVSQDDHSRASNKPEGEKQEEGIVETTLK